MNLSTAKFDFCLSASSPWVYYAKRDAYSLYGSVTEWQRKHPEVKVFFLHGDQMGTVDGFYDELAGCFKFPGYFGCNLNALNDCLTDDNVMQGVAFLVVIFGGDRLLNEASQDALSGFLDTLVVVSKEWATPVSLGEPWDRPARPFHTVIQCSDGGRFLHNPEISLLGD
jgi:RNAse (barnase) inhibitor barstar